MSRSYDAIAVRYGCRTTTRSETFYSYSSYGERDGRHEMAYYFWVLSHDSGIILVDTGYSRQAALRRGRADPYVVDPLVALAQLEIAPDMVTSVIVSHCHWDHIGNLDKFPGATIFIQSRELDFWSGPYGNRGLFRDVVENDEIEYIRRARDEGRVQCLDGDHVLNGSVSVQLIGGHCPGEQIVLVNTARNQVVLASDALHLYEELELDRPFRVFSDLADVYSSYDKLRALRNKGAIVVSGHDPLDMTKFSPVSDATRSYAVRIG